MKTIYRSQLPKSEAEVRADLAAWIAEVEAHKDTVGVPAPFPEYELLRHLVPGFVVLEDEDPEPEVDEPEVQFKTVFTSLEFLDRFTEDEQLAVVSASMNIAEVKLWWDKMLAASYVDINDPRTAEGIDALISAGLLEAVRRDEVLTPEEINYE